MFKARILRKQTLIIPRVPMGNKSTPPNPWFILFAFVIGTTIGGSRK